MKEGALSWLMNLRPEPSLLPEGPISVLAPDESADDLGRFRRCLFLHWMGKTDWYDVARELIRERDLPRVARLAPYVSSKERGALQLELDAEWRLLFQRLAERAQNVRAAVADLKKNDVPTGEVEEWLKLFDEERSHLPAAEGGALLEAIGRMPRGKIEEVARALEEAEGELSKARSILEKRRAQQKQRLAEVYERANDRIRDLSIKADLSEQAMQAVFKLQAAIFVALRNQDLAEMEAMCARLERLAVGDIPDIPLPPVDLSAARPPTRLVARGAPAALRRSDLTEWVQGRLKGREGGEKPSATPDELLRETLRSWEPAHLEQLMRGALVWEATGGERERVFALAVALVGEAKSALTAGDAEGALPFFLDAFRWSMAAGSMDATGAVERVRSAAAWGMLISLLAPFLPGEERIRVLDTRNLMALFYRPIGELPLARFDQFKLWGELAPLLLQLGEAAVPFAEFHLVPYLKGRSIATGELANGLISETEGQWSTSLAVLGLLFREIEKLPEVADKLQALDGEVRSMSDAPQTHRTEMLERVRRRILSVSERSELAASIEEAINLATQRLTIRTTPSPMLGSRLLTTELRLQGGERLVLEVNNRDPLRALRNLRVELTLVDDAGRPIPGAVTPPELVPSLAPEQRAEIPAFLARTDAEVLRAARLQLRFSRLDPTGKHVFVESNYTSFALRVLQPESEARRPPNPYVVGLAVKDRESIFGRDEEIEKICRALIGEKQDNAVLVLGERRMGKTTVLNAVAGFFDIQERYRDLVIRLDIQDVPTTELAADFFRHRLIDPISRHLTSVGIRSPIIAEGRLKQSPYQTFKDFMSDLDDSLGSRHRRALLVIDELEKLLTVVDQHPEPKDGTLGMEVMASLRAVFLRAKHISVILAGVTDVVRRHTSQSQNRLFKLAIEEELSRLPEEAARRLIEEPAAAARAYRIEPTARDILIGETSAHPYLLQYVSRELFEHMVRRAARVATRLDVEEVLERQVLIKADAFQHFVEAVPDAIDKRIVNALGALQRGDRTVPVMAIAQQIARTGGSISEEEISNRLLKLRARAPMVVDDRITYTGRFRLTVGLFARRLRRVQQMQTNLVLQG